MGGAYKGKPLIDVTNLVDTKNEFAGNVKKSGAEEVQELAKGARVVKAFNTVFAPNMSTGEVNGERLSLLYAGDDEKAKKHVRDTPDRFGVLLEVVHRTDLFGWLPSRTDAAPGTVRAGFLPPDQERRRQPCPTVDCAGTVCSAAPTAPPHPATPSRSMHVCRP